MVKADDITGTLITDNLLPTKKGRWKDIAETDSAFKRWKRLNHAD